MIRCPECGDIATDLAESAAHACRDTQTPGVELDAGSSPKEGITE